MNNIGEEEYEEIKKRINILWELILDPNNKNTPNINELHKLSNIAEIYEDKQEWDKYKKKWWIELFKDLKD